MSVAASRPGPAAVGDLRRLVDQQRLRHLDRAPRRPPGLGTARRGPGPVCGADRCRRRPARRRARRAAGRRGQRLVLVVRRRPLVGPRPGLRRAVPAPPRPRLCRARRAGARDAPPVADHDGGRRRRDAQARGGRRATVPRGSYFAEAGAVSLERSGGAMHRASAGPVTDARVGLVADGVVVTVELAEGRTAASRWRWSYASARRTRLRPGRSPTAPARCRGRRSAVRRATRSACGSWPATRRAGSSRPCPPTAPIGCWSCRRGTSAASTGGPDSPAAGRGPTNHQQPGFRPYSCKV